MEGNGAESVHKLLSKLGPRGGWQACYQAGPTGYTVYWQLTHAGASCVVVAPTLVPMRIGDRVKTDRRDAQRLARSSVFVKIVDASEILVQADCRCS